MSTTGHAAAPLSPRERRAVLEFLQMRALPEARGRAPAAGDSFGEFTLVRMLGRGGMGVVWLAQQPALGRHVALKFLPASVLEHDSATRFEREGRILASLRHPAIVAVHGAGAGPGLRWVAMEWIDGATLRGLIERGLDGLPRPGEARWRSFTLAVLERVASALAAAHAAGIVHRDVKPDNVLIDRQGRAYLADFGLARPLGGEREHLTRGFVGTPLYASPQQLDGLPPGPGDDVFAFGITAFEALTGRRPFPATDSGGERALRFRDPQWSSRDRIPRELRAVIERCLEKRPLDRYADGSELLADLMRFLRFEPVLAVARGPVSRLWRRVLLRPGSHAAAAGVLLLVLASAGLIVHARMQRASLARMERGARLERAVLALRAGRFEACRGALGPLLERAEEDALRTAAESWLWQGDLPRARELYATLEARGLARPSDRLGHWLAGGALDAPPAEELEPRSGDTWRDQLLRANAAARLGDGEMAVELLGRGLAMDQANHPMRASRARLLEDMGLREEALADLEVEHALRPVDVGVVLRMARLLEELERTAESQVMLRRVLRDFPDHPYLLAYQARSFGPAQAVEALESATRARSLLTRDPFVVEAWTLALCWNGRAADAQRMLTLAVADNPTDPRLRLALARVRLHADDPEGAEACLPQPDPLLPDLLLHILDVRAAAQQARGALPEARATLAELARLDPRRGTWRARLAELEMLAGDLEAARVHWEAALEQMPDSPRIRGILAPLAAPEMRESR